MVIGPTSSLFAAVGNVESSFFRCFFEGNGNNKPQSAQERGQEAHAVCGAQDGIDRLTLVYNTTASLGV